MWRQLNEIPFVINAHSIGSVPLKNADEYAPWTGRDDSSVRERQQGVVGEHYAEWGVCEALGRHKEAGNIMAVLNSQGPPRSVPRISKRLSWTEKLIPMVKYWCFLPRIQVQTQSPGQWSWDEEATKRGFSHKTEPVHSPTSLRPTPLTEEVLQHQIVFSPSE